jgi:hypothetical protein
VDVPGVVEDATVVEIQSPAREDLLGDRLEIGIEQVDRGGLVDGVVDHACILGVGEDRGFGVFAAGPRWMRGEPHEFSDLTVRLPGFPGVLRSKPSAGVLQSGPRTADFPEVRRFPRNPARGGWQLQGRRFS